MLVYRIAPDNFIDDLSGRGAELHGGRWNKIGIPALYTSQYRSLSALELLANANSYRFKISFSILELEISDELPIQIISINDLIDDWHYSENIKYTSELGSKWLLMKKTLVLSVPSAIINEENNFILNPHHPDFDKIKINKKHIFNFDKRLLKDHTN
ncbi:MAG: RES family NAD+ phosphorylase [Bacteroidota bacterium]|nr:RES family NAD+ phosphorylase [Bacteroidota bacterium]